MKQLLLIMLLFTSGLSVLGQNADKISIGKNDLQIKDLRLGNSTYIIYFKRSWTDPPKG
jgi:hypothetical protein